MNTVYWGRNGDVLGTKNSEPLKPFRSGASTLTRTGDLYHVKRHPRNGATPSKNDASTPFFEQKNQRKNTLFGKLKNLYLSIRWFFVTTAFRGQPTSTPNAYYGYF